MRSEVRILVRPLDPKISYRERDFVAPDIKCYEGRKAVVYWAGRRVYLGAWDGTGKPPTPVFKRYLRLLPKLEEKWRARLMGIEVPEAPES